MKTIVIILIILFALPAHAARVLEDFTTYTEVDTPGRFTVDSSIRVTVTDADRDEDFHLYSDKGAAFFSADYEHWFTVNYTGNALYQGTYWALANSIGSYNVFSAGDAHDVIIHNGSNAIYLQEKNAGVNTEDSMINGSGADLYVKAIRDEAVGANGTLYLYIYSDADRTSLTDTLTIALTEKQDFQYVYAVAGTNDAVTGRDWDGYIDSLSLSETAIAVTKRIIVFENSDGGGAGGGGSVGGTTPTPTPTPTPQALVEGANSSSVDDGIAAGSCTNAVNWTEGGLVDNDTTYTLVGGNNIDSGELTDEIRISNFGLVLDGTVSSIDGILVETLAWGFNGTSPMNYTTVQLFTAPGTNVGNNKATGELPGADPSTTYTSWGGAADKWGTTWTEAQIESTDFGLALCFTADADNSRINLDHVKITVYYTTTL